MSEAPRVRKPAPWVTIRKVVDHPELIGNHMSKGARHGFLLFLVSGIAIQTWALIPTTVPSGIYVALPDMTKVRVAENGSPKRGADLTGTFDVRSVASAEPVEFKAFAGARVGMAPGPQMAANPQLFGTLGEAPVKAKLQALLILLTSRFKDSDVSALIDKLRALLALPDSALVAVLGLPEMRDLSRLLDAASLGTVDLPKLTTEMGKIALTSAPKTPYRVEIAVNGRPTATVDMRYVRSDPSAPVAAAAPMTAPAVVPVGFVNVEPGVSIVAEAVTVSVLRAVEPVAATPILAAVATPEVLVTTVEATPIPEPAPTPTPVAPETFAPTTATAVPETFAPTTMTAAPETFAAPTMTAAPETVAPSETSTPDPIEPTRTTVEEEVSGTTPDPDDLNSGDNTESHSDETQGGHDSSPSNGDPESTGNTDHGGADADGGGDGPTGGREAGSGNDSASRSDGSDGGSPSS